MLIISSFNVFIAKRALDQTEQERIKAEEALTVAQSASKEALKAKDTALAAQALLNDLSLMADANAAAISAPTDINALRKLWDISKMKINRASVIAGKQLEPILRQIRYDYKVIISDYWGFKDIQEPDYYGLDDMEGWNRKEYIDNYMKVPDDRRVVYAIEFLSDEKESDDEKLSFCYSALQMETRPEIIYTISAYVDTKAKLNKDYLFETDYYTAWLKERSSKETISQ